ncbi:polyhydroxyalkanoic acid system family protein [Pseudoxanthomonas composti]|uniref:Polyhydroxyalkanoic acid synthase n=1 Tax=Pseudoxanthomonas composti TaxID=2137479 RepID=A0A4V1N1F8_9GAMM|nr:polyhydroxyalkanoic acid system family protein [Pseudoxanthomonas composti]RXR07499.1 polyhydroxyalkanoic acid synthase [Pseudoxanthomonas composti]
MSSIDIRHDHAQSTEQARASVDAIARKLEERFGVKSAWQGDRLSFNGAGVDGGIALLPQQLHVTAELNFLLSAMKGPIEAEIRRVLGERFS